jgi:phosphoethanolamine N-methyltransferase
MLANLTGTLRILSVVLILFDACSASCRFCIRIVSGTEFGRLTGRRAAQCEAMTESNPVDQDFLDSSQYEQASILQYESIYGEDFVSPGGREVAVEMIGKLGLAPGKCVLDVGCGLGGSAFVMAADFDLRVEGIDLSKNMLALAQRKLQAKDLAGKVELRWGDCLDLQCSDFYDAVYSRDVFLHIADKSRLFRVLYAALKPGGRLLFTDYCCGAKPWSDEFTAYVAARSYTLHTVDEYAGLIANAGFEQVDASDVTARFIELQQAELLKIDSLVLPESARGKLQQSWQQKIERALAGDQRWGLFAAIKAG